MADTDIPALSEEEANGLLAQAAGSVRRRHPKILHERGDVLNRVFNVMMHDSYMQPHLHPAVEKVEHIHLLRGKLAVLFFDDSGAVNLTTVLKEDGQRHIAVPGFTWHTYVMLTESAITYETMMGEYAPKTWKEFAPWAPAESTPESSAYLESLRSHAAGRSES